MALSTMLDGAWRLECRMQIHKKRERVKNVAREQCSLPVTVSYAPRTDALRICPRTAPNSRLRIRRRKRRVLWVYRA